MLRILIADDHPVVRQGLKATLEDGECGTVVGEARDGQETMDLARRLEWDLAILDYEMPGQGGAELVRRIKQYRPERPILVLSMYGDPQYALHVLKAGASGYLNKDGAVDELLLAVGKLADGGRYVSPSLADQLTEKMLDGGERPLHDALSDRERRIMVLLLRGRPVNEIARELCLSPSTISTYRSCIFYKLKLRSNADLIRYAVTNGLAI